MSRIAAWRRGPSDPRSAREWLFRLTDRPSTPEELRRMRWGLGRRTIIAVALGGLYFILHRLPPLVGPAAVALGPLLDSLGKRRDRKLPQPLALEPPGPGEAFEVRVAIRDLHGIATGRDRGWLIFSDGWVLFEGARTEFAVTRGESYRRSQEPALGLKLEDGRTVVFSPIGQHPIPKQLNRAFIAWEVAPIPDGEAVLPPWATHPEIWVERHSLWTFAAVATTAFGIFGAMIGWWTLVVPSVGMLILCLWGTWDCGRRLREALPATGLLLPSSGERVSLPQGKR